MKQPYINTASPAVLPVTAPSSTDILSVRKFPENVEYSGDIFEKQAPPENNDFTFTASDGKPYSLKQNFADRSGVITLITKPEKYNIFAKAWDWLKEALNIGNTRKKAWKAYINASETIENSNNINDVFYKLTGVEYTPGNAEKLLTGEIKYKFETAIEKYMGRPLRNLSPAAPYISKYYVNETSLKNMEDTRKELNETETEQFETIKNALTPEYKTKFENALKNGQLLKDDSDNQTTVLESLYKILTTPRAENLDSTKILEECIEILDNPYVITQFAEDIPEEYQEECTKRIISHEMELYKKSLQIQITTPTPNPNVINENFVRNTIISPNIASLFEHRNVGTCSAASIEFYLANSHTAEFFNMIEALTSEKKSYTKIVKPEELNSNKTLPSTYFLDICNIPYKMIDENDAEITIAPDENAYLLAEIQTKYKDELERSIVDIIMQSTIMNLGSRGTYESISDKREANEWTPNDGGLVEFESNFVLGILTEGHVKDCTYKLIDRQGNISNPYKKEDIKNEILDALNRNGSVVAGQVYSDFMAHEITVIGYTTNMKGDGFFIIQDSDDLEAKPVAMPEEMFLDLIHHAFI